MNGFILTMPIFLVVLGIGYAYAEPLSVNVEIIEYADDSATVKMTWNDDPSVFKYEIGCVSCSPNVSEISMDNNITLNDVSTFPNTSNALLYVIAYDSEDEIVDAKQILIDVTE